MRNKNARLILKPSVIFQTLHAKNGCGRRSINLVPLINATKQGEPGQQTA